MTKNQYGVWEITVPATPTGECAIPHDSKVKVRPRRLPCAPGAHTRTTHRSR